MTLYFSGFYPSETAEGAKGSAAFLASTNIAIIQLYRRSATTLGNGDKPNGVVTYTFATANTDLSLVTNGWTTTIPSGSDPLYVVAATAASSSATDTIATNEWATPVILVQNGTQGLSTATVFLFKRGNTSTAPAVPSQPATYTFATGELLGTSSVGNTVSPFLDGWSQTAPDSAGNKYLFVTTATAISTGANDTITTSEWATVRVLAQDGAVGYTSYLTNESHTLPADTAGNVSTYSGATGQFKVFLDGVGDISSNFTLSTLANPQTLTIAYSTNTYTVSGGFDLAEETASITIRATGSGAYSGVILDKVFSLSKAKAGSNGTSAKIISVTSDRQLISFDSEGALSPTTQTTTLSVNKQNTSATVNWTMTDTLGTVLTPATYLSATTGDSITLTAANFQAATAVNASEGVIITATVTDGTTMVDKVTIMKVKAGINGIDGIDGIDGVDGINAVSGVLTNETFVTTAANDGTGYTLTNSGGTFKVFSGSIDVTTSATFSVSGSAAKNGLTIAIVAGTGVYSLSGASWTSDSETFVLQAVYSGVTIQKTYKISKVKNGLSGSSPTTYSLTPSVDAIRKNAAGTLTPSSITFTSTSTTGSALPVAYAGRYIIATSVDGSTFTDQYTSATNESSRTYTVPAGALYVRTRLYLAGGTTTQLDQQTVAILSDGINGIDGIDGVDGVDGVDGISAVSGLLTNETFVTTAANDGTGYTLTNSGGTFKIFSGSIDVTTSATFSVSGSATLNGLTMSIVSGTGVYSLSGASWTSDSETFILQAVYSGITIQKSYKISKVKNGLPGASPTTYSVTSSVDSIRKNALGALSPTSITFNSTSTTGASLPVAYAGRYIIATSTDGVTFTNQYTSAANESSRTYTVPAGALYIRARLYLAGGTTTQLDQQTVSVISDGINGIDGIDGIDGVDGAPAISAFLTSEAASLFAYADGTVVSFSTANGLFKLMSGTTDVTSLADNFSATGSGCTGTINTANNIPINGQLKGYYRVTAMTSDTATLTLSARYPAGTGNIFTKVFTLSKTRGGYEILAALPSSNLFQGRTVFLTTDNKLYRHTGSAWTSAVPATDISGVLADAQIAAVAASKVTGQLTDTQIAAVAAAKVSGTLTDSQLADISAAKITGQLVSTQLADASISTAKFAGGIEPVTTVSSVPGSKSTSTIFNTSDGKLYRWNGSAYIATVPAADLSGQVTNVQIASVDAVKVSGTLTDSQLADISAAKITGQLANTQIAAVDASKVSGTLTDAQLAGISAAKISGQITSTQISDGAISTNKIAANSITAAQIAADTITANEIAANAITANEIAANTITAAQIAADTITSSQIAANAITTNELAANAVTANQIAANTITAAQIAADTITSNQIAANAITTNELAANSVTAAQIAANTITAAQIAADTITSNQIASNAITTNEIAANAVTAAQIAANTITSAQIAADTITAGNIASGAITAAELAAGAVTAEKITVTSRGDSVILNPSFEEPAATDSTLPAKWTRNRIWGGSSITAFRDTTQVLSGSTSLALIPGTGASADCLADLVPVSAGEQWYLACKAKSSGTNAGTSPGFYFRVRGGATSSSIGMELYIGVENATVPTSWTKYEGIVTIPAGMSWAAPILLNYSSNTGAKISVDDVEFRKVVTSATIADGAITANKIAAGSITATQIAADTITANQIAANAITAAEISAGAVTAGKIAADSITSNEIAANAITAAEIAAATITGAKIAAGTIQAGNIAADTITADKIAANAITASELAANAVTADKINAGSITAAKLAATNVVTLSAQIGDGIITNAKIGDAQITTAKIQDLQVTTLKIGDNAVTVPISVYTSSLISTPFNTTTTIQSASIVASGAPILIVGSFTLFSSTSTSPTIFIFRDGVQIYTAFAGAVPLGSLISVTINDTPSAGTYTYSIGVRNLSSGASVSASQRTLSLLEVKK